MRIYWNAKPLDEWGSGKFTIPRRGLAPRRYDNMTGAPEPALQAGKPGFPESRVVTETGTRMSPVFDEKSNFTLLGAITIKN